MVLPPIFDADHKPPGCSYPKNDGRLSGLQLNHLHRPIPTTNNAACADLTIGMYSGQFGFLYIEQGVNQKTTTPRSSWRFICGSRPQKSIWGRPTMAWKFRTDTLVSMARCWATVIRYVCATEKGSCSGCSMQDLRIALPGHQFLDDNPVLTPRAVSILQIGVAERIRALWR